MELVVLEESLHRVQSLLEELGVNHDRPWVVIHPGATALPRRYPPESFAVVAKQLVRDANIQVIFTGTENDYPIRLLLARLKLNRMNYFFC
jgi:ADP-heptose:LPS heptosyltransferase